MDHWNNFVDSETLCNLDNANAKHCNVSWNLNITLLKICTMREDGRKPVLGPMFGVHCTICHASQTMNLVDE